MMRVTAKKIMILHEISDGKQILRRVKMKGKEILQRLATTVAKYKKILRRPCAFYLNKRSARFTKCERWDCG